MNVGEPDAAARLHTLFSRTAFAAAALTFVVIVASAFMRHMQVGLACADWPACYGRIVSAATDGARPTVRIVRGAHRIAATGVLALVIGMLLIAWTQRPAWKREGTLAVAALLLAAALAVLGIVTPGARLPAVTLGNLLGGYLMLAALTATAVAATTTRSAAPRRRWMPEALLPWLALAVLVLVFAQAALGGSIGAQYALTACPTLGRCPGFPFDGFRATAALDPFRPLTIIDGRVMPPPDAAALYVIHRTLGLVVAVFTLLLARAVRSHDRRLCWLLAALALATPLAGVVAIVVTPSLPLTVLHNGLAALLVAAIAAVAARTYGLREIAANPD